MRSRDYQPKPSGYKQTEKFICDSTDVDRRIDGKIDAAKYIISLVGGRKINLFGNWEKWTWANAIEFSHKDRELLKRDFYK